MSGRYFAMDRDQRWDRVAKAYEAVVAGRGVAAPTARAAIEAAYARGESDEFIAPTVVGGTGGPAGMRDGDSAVFFNFRADRARELTRALTDPSFGEFPRDRPPRLSFVCFTEYKKEFGLPVAFPPISLQRDPRRRLGRERRRQPASRGDREVRARDLLLQRRRRARVSGRGADPRAVLEGRDVRPPPGDERGRRSRTRLVAALERPEPPAIVANFANADMVGHTGKLPETIAAIETLDRCFAPRRDAPPGRRGAVLLMTADHGNAEQMIDPETGEPHTAHTTNPVPFVQIGGAPGRFRKGTLADVAPTILRIQGLSSPREMTGRDLAGTSP